MLTKTLFLFSAYFVIQSSYVSEAALPPVCPYPVGYMPDPKNCSQFVICMDFQVAGVGACPKGLYFSEAFQDCTYPHWADCSDHSKFIIFFNLNFEALKTNKNHPQIVAKETCPKLRRPKRQTTNLVVQIRRMAFTRISPSVARTTSAKTALHRRATVWEITNGAPNSIGAISRRTVIVPNESSYCPTQRPVHQT